MPRERRTTRELLDIVSDSPTASSAEAKAIMVRNRRRDTKTEREVRSVLHRSGLRFRVDYPIRCGRERPIRPDIVFTRARVAVFVDGCFWHGCPLHGRMPKTNNRYWQAKIDLNQDRDERQTALLRGAGWDVLRVWEHVPATEAAQAIAAAVARS